MDVIEIDHVDAEPLEARLAGDRHIVGLAVDAAALAARPADVAELARDQELVALALDRLPDQLLVDASRIGIGGVEHGDAKLDAAVDGRNRLDVVGHTVVGAHAGAPKPDRRHAQSLSELPILHHLTLTILSHAAPPKRRAGPLLKAFRGQGKSMFEAPRCDRRASVPRCRSGRPPGRLPLMRGRENWR